MVTGFHPRTRSQLFADKFLFDIDTLVSVNALDLLEELTTKDHLSVANNRLQARVDALEYALSLHINAKLTEPRAIVTYDIKGNLS
jgi:hypothetical protein